MSSSWLISGVGRSGTTAVYAYLQDLAAAAGEKRAVFYEPYLWGEKVWRAKFNDELADYSTTRSINPKGLAAHLLTPLFLEGDAPEVHKAFEREMLEDGPSLIKMIRGCGRLAYLLERHSELKAIAILRNPLDCINSQVGRFSYFGGEFHPPDDVRFRAERGLSGDWSSECEASAAWWSHMNEAMLNAAKKYPNRVFVLPYEAIPNRPDDVRREIAAFLGVGIDIPENIGFTKKVGAITRRINLKAGDVDHLKPLCKDYFERIDGVSSISIGEKPDDALAKVLQKYEAVPAGHFEPEAQRELTSLRLRNALTKVFEEKEQALTYKLNNTSQKLKGLEAKHAALEERFNELVLRHKDLEERNKLLHGKHRHLQNQYDALKKLSALQQEKIDLLDWVLEPRLLTLLKFRPLRHVMNERRRIKAQVKETVAPTVQAELPAPAQQEIQKKEEESEKSPVKPEKKPSVYDDYAVTKPLGIAVFGYDRADIVYNTLKSLETQSAIGNVVVYIDGDQGRPQKRRAIDRVEEAARQFDVAEIHRNRGNFGFRKMMLLGMQDMMDRYERILFLEDDCFPTGAAVKGFSKELDRIENDPTVFSVYGHPFLVPGERAGDPFPRFQGWGWATTREKLLPIHKKLLESYLMPERDYLAFVERTLTPELKQRIDATPGRQPSDTIEKFFAWDETLCLLTAAEGMSHLCAEERIIYNCGAGEGSAHFTNTRSFRDPPFNLITPKEVWEHF